MFTTKSGVWYPEDPGVQRLEVLNSKALKQAEGRNQGLESLPEPRGLEGP